MFRSDFLSCPLSASCPLFFMERSVRGFHVFTCGVVQKQGARRAKRPTSPRRTARDSDERQQPHLDRSSHSPDPSSRRNEMLRSGDFHQASRTWVMPAVASHSPPPRRRARLRRSTTIPNTFTTNNTHAAVESVEVLPQRTCWFSTR